MLKMVNIRYILPQKKWEQKTKTNQTTTTRKKQEPSRKGTLEIRDWLCLVGSELSRGEVLVGAGARLAAPPQLYKANAPPWVLALST